MKKFMWALLFVGGMGALFGALALNLGRKYAQAEANCQLEFCRLRGK